VERYLNLNGTSGVVSYEIGFDFIRIEFRNDAVYGYDFSAPGKEHVERMKELAISGRGLSSYVSRHVRNSYARRE
jgi:hypothetical protein